MNGLSFKLYQASLKHLTMKKSNSISRLILLAGLGASNLTFGQYTTNPRINSNALSESMKGDLNKEIANRKAFENLKAINVKLYKDFSRYFPTASDIRTTTDKYNIMVNCEVNGVKTRVNYNNNGRWVSTLRMMETAQLPEDLTNDITEAYPGYKVSRGKEVIVGPHSAYLVDIENEITFRTVRIIDGEFDIYEEFRKQQNK
jgi:hypothetical protein